MYQIDKVKNDIKKLEKRLFGDLGFRERDHLQEWIAKHPEVLGEELLIIQKEFDGFDDTKERLDLLALDKDGGLVIIENKLDDSGKNVTWQALKYASYCSTLTKVQVVDVYQKYIDKYEGGGDAKAQIVSFLGEEDFDSIVLNKGVGQRIMFVANKFRKEVTSTVLWLLEQQLQIQCFKATPYSMGEELFLQIDQIIPTPEAKEFMIGISAKNQESKQVEKEMKSTQILRKEFWSLITSKMRESESELHNNISPSKTTWLSSGSGISAVHFDFGFLKELGRVELYIGRKSKEENKFIFDELYKEKDAIESVFGDTLQWNRLDEKKACGIKCEKAFDGNNREVWEEMTDYLVASMIRFEKALKPHLITIRKDLIQTFKLR
jgi:hypothetical protein